MDFVDTDVILAILSRRERRHRYEPTIIEIAATLFGLDERDRANSMRCTINSTELSGWRGLMELLIPVIEVRSSKVDRVSEGSGLANCRPIVLRGSPIGG